MTVEVLRAAAAEARPGALQVPTEALRTRALLEMDPVLDEIERRAAVGLSSILSMRLLEALRDLPADLPVPRDSLTAETLKVLSTSPAGCVEFVDECVVRLAVPPVQIVSAGVCASSWQEGLRQASQFASYCTRYAVMTSDRFDEETASMEARFYGIGLAAMVDGPESFAWLVAPETFRPSRETAESWHFSECALEALSHNPDLGR